MPNPSEAELESTGSAIWNRSAKWSFILFAGWLIYELTTLPALAVVTVCLRFGWNDFKTAFWLRRRDPVRGRAYACSFMYLAWGLWKTALTAVVPMLLIAVATIPGLPNGKLPPMALLAAVCVMEAGFLFSALTTCFSLVIALRTRSKIWLHSSIHQDQADNLWPPVYVLHSSKNHLSRPLTVGLFVVCIPFIVVGMVCVEPLFPKHQAVAAGQPMADGAAVLVALLALSLVAFPIGIMKLSEWLQKRIGAHGAHECWPDAYYSDIGED